MILHAMRHKLMPVIKDMQREARIEYAKKMLVQLRTIGEGDVRMAQSVRDHQIAKYEMQLANLIKEKLET